MTLSWKAKTAVGVGLVTLVVFNFTLPSVAKAAFDPSSISGLKLWLKADSGVTTDGTTPASDGDLVQSWNDQSGNINNATSTGPSRPTYVINAINGEPALQFSGSQSMVTPSFLDNSFDTNFTFFLIDTNNSSTAVTTSNQNALWFSARSPTAQAGLLYDTGSVGSQISTSSVGSYVGVETFRYNGSSRLLRFNGVDEYNQAITGNMGLNGSLTLGQLSGGGFSLNGNIAELLIYNEALTNPEIDQVEQYLETKYVRATSTLPQIIFDGDSMTLGIGSTGGQTYPFQSINLLGGSGVWYSQDDGVSGQTVAQMISDAPEQVDVQYDPNKSNNIVALLGGTNDLAEGSSPTVAYNNIMSYAQGRRNAGFKVIVNTILPRNEDDMSVSTSTFETERQAVNADIRANWHTFADGISDIALDPRIGLPNAELNNSTYYSDAGVHPNNAGYGVIASYVAGAVNQILSPIAVSGISGSATTTNSALINWSTNQLGSTIVSYGTSSAYATSTTEIDTSPRVLSHSVYLSGLNDCTTYHYQVQSNDLNGNQATSTDQTFTTTGCPQSTPTAIPGVGTISGWGSVGIPPGGTVTPPTNTNVCSAGELFNTATGASCPASSSTTLTQTSAQPTWGFIADLQLKSTSPQVKLLQEYLNQHGYTVASTGAGSRGNETDYFGALTKAALIKFQKANGITPAVGYFGPITRAYISSH